MTARDWTLEAQELLGPEATSQQLEVAAGALQVGYNMGWNDFARRIAEQLALEDETNRAMLRRGRVAEVVKEDKP